MSTHRPPRPRHRALAPLLLALLLVLPAGAARAEAPPAGATNAAAAWLVSALTDDPAIDTEFGPSPGLTIDALLALTAAGVAGDTIEAMADWLATQAPGYTQGVPFEEEEGTAYAGASAKLALAMLVVDRDPRDVAGIDLLDQLASLEVTDPEDPALGRFRDRSGFGDFSTPLTQSLALLTLHRAPGVEPSPAAVAALVDQACPDGGFPAGFDPESCTSSVDTTGFAVQALQAVGADGAAEAAADWLVATQAADGSFSSPDGVNTNSTGLAAAALAATDREEAAEAARTWIISQQDDCTTDSPGAIPFNVSERGSVPLATAQATVGLAGASLATVTSAGATAEVPATGCPEPEAPGTDTPADGGSDLPGEDEADVPVDVGGDADVPVGDGSGGGDIPQPTEVDAGLSPSAATVPAGLALTLLLGVALVAGGLLRALQRSGSR